MITPGPFFTERVTGKQQRILDPLGLDAAGATIIRRHLLPGITSGLQHARYFSFMSWIAGSFSISRTRLDWQEYRQRLEHALRIAAKCADGDLRGIVGATSTPIIKGSKGTERVLLKNSAPSCFEAQYYGASFGSMQLADRPRGRAPDLRPLGDALYTAVEDAIRAEGSKLASVVEKLQTAPSEMLVRDLEILADFFRFREIKPGEPEFEPLLSAVGGLDSDNAFGTQNGQVRARVFALILAVLSEPGTKVGTWYELLHVLTGPRLPIGIAESFGEVLEAWRCFGERQSERLVFGGLWSVVLEWIRSEGLEGVDHGEILHRARALAGASLKGLATDKPIDSITWGEFEDAVAVRAGNSLKKRFDFRNTLLEELYAPEDKSSMKQRIALALTLAAECNATWKSEERAGDPFAYELHNLGGPMRMTVAWLTEELEAKRGWTLLNVLTWLIERCVLEQLQRVGYSKNRGSDALLLARDESRLILARPDATIQPLAQDTNRLEAALRLMQGLSLVTVTEGVYRTTPSGQEFLGLVLSG